MMLVSDLAVGNRIHELAALVALIRTKVVPQTRIAAYADRHGSAVTLAQLSENDRLMSMDESVHEVIGAVTDEVIDQAMATVTRWFDQDLTVHSCIDPEYPDNLRGIFNRPPFLFVEGEWREYVDNYSISIVGTRGASDLGLERAKAFSKELSCAGFTILSGMATGIDTAAHSAAMEAGGRTVAVMGTGLDYRYPAVNRELASRIVDSGSALLTQFEPEQGPRPWTFPMRNVVMSGLSLGTVVIEASETSGAKMQARVALQHGRTVFLHTALVQSHKWAHEYVNDGRYDTHAIEVSSPSEIVSRVDDAPELEPVSFG